MRGLSSFFLLFFLGSAVVVPHKMDLEEKEMYVEDVYNVQNSEHCRYLLTRYYHPRYNLGNRSMHNENIDDHVTVLGDIASADVVVIFLQALNQIEFYDRIGRFTYFVELLYRFRNKKLAVVFPQPPVLYVTFRERWHTGWYDFKHKSRRSVDLLPNFVNSLKFVSRVVSKYQRMGKKVYLSGFSQGGALALMLAYSKRSETAFPLDGVIVFSSYVITEERLDSERINKTEFLWLHSEHDTMVPSFQASSSVQFFKDIGIKGHLKFHKREFELNHGFDDECVNDIIKFIDEREMLFWRKPE